jgi:hypothetical protein
MEMDNEGKVDGTGLCPPAGVTSYGPNSREVHVSDCSYMYSEYNGTK